MSEILKRKPEYNGGIAKYPDKAEFSQLVVDHPELVSKDPDSLESLESLQDAQINAENNKALAFAKEAVRLRPNDGFAWYALGEAYMKLNDYRTAEEPLKRALKAFLTAPPPSDPRDRTTFTMLASTSLALAEVCDKLHRKREAERYRNGALMLLPTH